nr:hypothetical protein [Bacteroidota bacterium]
MKTQIPRIISLTTTCFLLLSALMMKGQYINGPANIRDLPNGEKLFSVNDYIKIDIVKVEPNYDWFKVSLNCYVKPESLIDKKNIKPGSALLDINGDSIGFTYKQFDIYENHDKTNYKYHNLDEIHIALDGYTYKSNIRTSISFNEILENKPSFADSCFNQYLTYQEENGMTIKVIKRCELYEEEMKKGKEFEKVFIREIQEIKRISGAEGQASAIRLEMMSDYLTNNPVIRTISVEADKVEIYNGMIKSVKYGCCGGENRYQLYNYTDLKMVMEYDAKLYSIEIPNSNIKGYLGYESMGYNSKEMIVGKLHFSDGEKIINTVNFFTKDKETYRNILRFVPGMEFKTLDKRDEIHRNNSNLKLWSGNFSKSIRDITGFKFIVHISDDSSENDYTQELEFVDGYINGDYRREINICIDN